MREPPPNPDWLDDALRNVRRDLAGLESVRPHVERRIAHASIRPAARARLGLPAALILLIVTGLAVWRSRSDAPSSNPPGGIATSDPRRSPGVLQVQMDGVEVTTHLAAVVDRRAVLVVWSGPDDGRARPGPADPDGVRAGKYRRFVLPPGRLANGRAAAACLYIADDGVRPVLEPPMVIADSGTRGPVAFSVSPRVTSAAELPEALRAAGLDAESGRFADDIYRELRKHSH